MMSYERSEAEIKHPELNVIKVTKLQLKELISRCRYKALGYSGIGAFYVRGHQHMLRGLVHRCRWEDYRGKNA